jgi:hypothetical protein
LFRRLKKIVNRKTVIIGLFTIVIVESSILAVFAVSSVITHFLTSVGVIPSSGDFNLGCPVLQATPVYNESLVRWLTLTCPSGPALSLVPTGYCGVHEPGCTVIYPTFAPPPGLMGLYLYDHGASGCPFTQSGSLTEMTPLQNGIDVMYFNGGSLDYCAVVKQSTGTIDGFTVKWTAGFLRGHNSGITASVTNATITIGNSATLTLRVMNQYNFDVTLQFAEGMTWLTPNYNHTFTGMTFNPPIVTVKAANSNSTTVTVTTSSSQVPGDYEVELDANPIYGLRFYGDYVATPSYGGVSAFTYLKLTS